MSAKLMASVYEYELSHGQQAILIAMADHADDDGSKCFPSLSRIAWKTGYDRRHVQRMTRELQKMGVLVEVARSNRRHPTEYQIELSAAKRKAPYVTRGDIYDMRGDISNNQGRHPDRPNHQENHQKEPSDTSSLPTRKKEQPQASEVVQPSIERLCDLMAQLQNERLGRSEYTASTTWKRDMRLLVEKDGRSVEAVERCLRWIHEHDFWSTNVLSPGKLRKQWNRLELEAKRGTKREPAPESEPEDDLPAKLRAQGRFEEAEEAEKWA